MDVEISRAAALLGSKERYLITFLRLDNLLSFKTTYLMHYGYLIVENLAAMNVNSEEAFGIIICNILQDLVIEHLRLKV